MTNNELRDSIAKEIILKIHGHQPAKDAAKLSFDYADAYMSERHKRGSWDEDAAKTLSARSYIGAPDKKIVAPVSPEATKYFNDAMKMTRPL